MSLIFDSKLEAYNDLIYTLRNDIKHVLLLASEAEKSADNQKLALYLKFSIIGLATLLEVFIEDSLKEVNEYIKNKNISNEYIFNNIFKRLVKEHKLRDRSLENMDCIIAKFLDDCSKLSNSKASSIRFKELGNFLIDVEFTYNQSTISNIINLFKQFKNEDIFQFISNGQDIKNDLSTFIHWRNQIVHQNKTISDLTLKKAIYFRNVIVRLAHGIKKYTENKIISII